MKHPVRAVPLAATELVRSVVDLARDVRRAESGTGLESPIPQGANELRQSWVASPLVVYVRHRGEVVGANLHHGALKLPATQPRRG